MNKLNNYTKRRNLLLREINKCRIRQEIITNRIKLSHNSYHRNEKDFENYTIKLKQQLIQKQQLEQSLITKYNNIQPTINLTPLFLLLAILPLIFITPQITGFQIFQQEPLELQPQSQSLQQSQILTISITPDPSVYQNIYIYNNNNILQDRIRICNTIECTIPIDALYNTSILTPGNYYIILFDYNPNILDWIRKDFLITELLPEEEIPSEILSEELIQGEAILNKKVTWTQKNTLTKPSTITIPILPEATSLRVRDKILGPVYKEITDFTLAETKLSINEEVENLVIEYTTPPTTSKETQVNTKLKRIQLQSNITYQDVLTFTSIPETKDTSKIKLSRVVNEKSELVTNITYLDTNQDGATDKIQWNSPTSNETYNLIIEITKAEHLDSSRIFISDIFNEVKALDNIWSETIPSGDYVRVTFEQELDLSKDITIYPRTISSCSGDETVIVNGTEISCEIYQKKQRIDEIRGLLE